MGVAARRARSRKASRLASGSSRPVTKRTDDDEFIAQPLAGKKGGIGVDVARSHVTHGEAVDVQAIDERPKDGTIDKPAEPPEERPMPAQHSGQRSAPSRGAENEPRFRRRGACGM